MNIPISTTANGRLHAVVPNRLRGRPLDLAKPYRELINAVDRRVMRLEKRVAKLQREIRRSRELAVSLNT